MTNLAKPNGMDGVPPEVAVSDEMIQRLAVDHPDQIFILSMGTRPGWTPFMIELEYTHYTPDTPKNVEFEMFIVTWPKDPGEEMMWCILGLPTKDLEMIKELGKKYNFHFSQGATPLIISSGKEQWFPMTQAENLYTVEGFIQDKAKVTELTKHWYEVIEKHASDFNEAESKKL